MKKHSAFTMAEILLSLTIIGVVAAITLPSLTGNINERTWNTQRKALYARFSQGLALMPSLGGYGTYKLAGTDAEGNATSAQDTAAETFVTEGLSKVIKINNICDHEHLQDCGIVSSYTNMAGSINSWPTKLSEMNSMFTGTYNDGPNGTGGTDYTNPQKDIDTFAAAFETQNGESIAIYYNPYCQSDMNENSTYYSQTKMCANFIYDLNGNKGPNTVGKDIGFITAIYPSDPIVVAPLPVIQAISGKKQSEASEACTAMDAESRLPNIHELQAMFYNKDLLGMPESGGFWSSSVISSTTAWDQSPRTGQCFPDSRSYTRDVRCIKR